MNQVPKLVGSVARGTKEKDIEEVFQCTSGSCGGLFIAAYKPDVNGLNYKFARSFPVDFIAPIVGDLLRELSPTFFETYSQALQAEALGLMQLTGIGLRKALEFLVKDFAIGEDKAQEAAIRKKLLAKCIEDHVTDSSVQNLAKRAAWLGNDETHYVRRWEDKDVSDLKVLLRLTMNGIENRLLEKKYLAEMPDASAKPV